MAHYFGDAVNEIKQIKGKEDGHLDFATMPTFAKCKCKKSVDGLVIEEDARDLGAMVTMLVVAVQQLTARIEQLEKPKV